MEIEFATTEQDAMRAQAPDTTAQAEVQQHVDCFLNATEELCGCAPFTDAFGRPVHNDSSSETVGENGPTLLQDIYFIEKLAHFDRERIPERVVHAKGAGAFGTFVCENSMAAYTRADVFSQQGKTTRVFTRFSTVIGSKGSADTVRDPRGFAVKFYTGEGNLDIVGNDLPVFFIRDAIKFPDVIHSLKPSPANNLIYPQRFWDFISLTPEATHMITWLYSDRGTIKSYRHVEGFGVNTYVWVNGAGQRFLIKYHWKTAQGVETIDRFEAHRLAGTNPDIAVQDLYDAICRGDYPRYHLCVQIMTEEQGALLPFDPLDDTKTWNEEQFPLYYVGTMTLHENPESFFAQTEQSAFCPANLVPGIELSFDKMLQGRSFSYADTQRHRIGPNFADLPINRPVVPVNNNLRDGAMTYNFNACPINYSPNSLNNDCPRVQTQPPTVPAVACGPVVRAVIRNTDDFTQAGERYDAMTEAEKNALSDNIAVEVALCDDGIVNRLLGYFYQASPDWANRVRERMIHYRI